MSDFSKYFLMTTEDVPKYVQSKLTYFSEDAKLSCTEIGDGNINYVFRVQDENGKRMSNDPGILPLPPVWYIGIHTGDS